jgi:hypothetical protein
MAVVVPLKDASAYFGRLNAAMFKRAAQRGLVLAGQRGVQVVVTQIIPSRTPAPVDRGVYRAGWKSESIDENTVLISNPEPHAVLIEKGVRAENVKIGAVMIRALSEWALRKGIARDEKESVGIAWAIAKTMQKRGIFNRRSGNGLRILEELERDHLPKIAREEIAREMQSAANGAR